MRLFNVPVRRCRSYRFVVAKEPRRNDHLPPPFRLFLLMRNLPPSPPTGPVIDVPLERVFETYNTNVFSVLRMSKAVIPHMAAQRTGAIVNIACLTGEM